MKETMRFMLSAFAIVAAASCAKEIADVEIMEEPVGGGLVPMVLTADAGATKAAIDGNSIVWSEDDAIAVWDGTAVREFTVEECDGKRATFSGLVAEGASEFYASYPYNEDFIVTDGVMSVVIPEVQTIPSDANIDPAALVMAAKVAGDNTLQFKNVFALAMVVVASEGINAVSFRGNANEKVTGAVSVDADGTPSCVGGAKATIKPASGSFEKNGVYYIAIAPVTCTEGITVACHKEGETVFKKGKTKASFNRSKVFTLGDVTDGVAFANPIMTAAQLRTFAENADLIPAGETVELGADIDLDGVAWTPAKDFIGVFDGNNHKVYNAVITSTTTACGLFGTVGNESGVEAGVKNLVFGSKDGSTYDGKSSITLTGSNGYGGVIPLVCSGSSVENITNFANINCSGQQSSATVNIGGIAGSGNSANFESCVNKGTITLAGGSGDPVIYAGGICGGNISNSFASCDNEAAIIIDDINGSSCIGGICAEFTPQSSNMTNCSNTGSFKVSKDSEFRIGGLVGNCNRNNTSTPITDFEACSVNLSSCILTSKCYSNYFGLIIGRFNDSEDATNNENAITNFGSESNPIKVYAGQTITVGNNNYSVPNGASFDENGVNGGIYLMGQNSNNTVSPKKRVINIFGTTKNDVDRTSGYYVHGTVSYSDGRPAAGVSVSDGFTVALTDPKGCYEFNTCKDSKYIYVSYPSDVKITTSNGCPEFFKPYSKEEHTYDFSFDKITPENEFILFAMTDPQAHYIKGRGGWNIADTDRFLNESVPAINAQIAAQSLPCYGVTLGDIVYSSKGSDSTPGMAVMREHFSKVNMPVFQTMGNHDYDYSFFNSGESLSGDITSNSNQIKMQQDFEDAFGPINYSFNRGEVHIVCMRNVIFTNRSDAGSSYGGFTNEQFEWFKADLANVPKSKKIILCVHVPLCDNTSRMNVSSVLKLMKQYTNSEIFSGHTHYKRGCENVSNSGIYEHVHSAVCGTFWSSNMECDGVPNGYTVYHLDGTNFKDEYFIGVNEGMNSRDCQMRVYRGNCKTGGTNAYFQWQHSSKTILINVFNGDSRWKSIKVYEDGVYSSDATNITKKTVNPGKLSKGTTYKVSTDSSNDYWAIGYHIGYMGVGNGDSNYYTTNYHMYKATLKSSSSKVEVRATDPYGNVYICTEVIEDGTKYPDYLSAHNK